MTVVGGHLSLERCPRCGVARPLLVSGGAIGPVPTSPGFAPTYAAIYRCTNCGGAVLATAQQTNPALVPSIQEILPTPPAAHEDLPLTARRYLDQAYATLAAPDAATVMAGSAVDAMLKAIGYDEGSVYVRINKAVGDNKLTESMGRWAHSVRLEANRPRHADGDDPHVSPEQAKMAVEFAEALGHFLFVLTARIDRGILAATEAG